MVETETRFVVRYAETDQMGIVHHSCYPIWFEAGRTDFIRKMGLPYSEIEKMGFLLPLIELKCTYKGFACYEDEILVRTRVKELTCARVVFYYQVFKEDGKKLITTGETMHAWTNKALKPLNIKKHAPQIYDLISKTMSA